MYFKAFAVYSRLIVVEAEITSPTRPANPLIHRTADEAIFGYGSVANITVTDGAGLTQMVVEMIMDRSTLGNSVVSLIDIQELARHVIGKDN